jgi:glyoxylase-like metal-dependent hydrolase (beta-lactamase superfamily II)
MARSRKITSVVLRWCGAAVLASAALVPSSRLDAQDTVWTADIAAARRVASLLPGRKPLRVNVVKFAESRRTKNFSVQGAPAQPSVQARTAFQVVYADGTVMVDAGMNQQVHRFFGRGTEEPYDAAAAQTVAAAVDRARLIVFTHEHGDHVGGVVASPRAAELAVKTILTRRQADTLTAAPQMPEIRLTAADARRYIVIDYHAYYPVAPGLAFIEAAGHTPGSQMILVQLESGREIVLAGDVTWHMDGVRLVAGKDAPWVVEDKPAVLGQLRWLKGLLDAEPNLVIVPSHDDELRQDLVSRGVLGGKFE